MNRPETRTTIIETLAELTRIYREDSNAILAADLNGDHKGNSPAVFAELVARIVNLDR